MIQYNPNQSQQIQTIITLTITQRSRMTTPEQQTQLTIEKALEFAGDNSQYQKKRLMLLSLTILTLAILTCKVAFMGTPMILLFLAACALGQFTAPLYLSLDFCALAILLLSALSALLYPFSAPLTHLCLLALGYFGRGFFACSLLYLNEIGGDRFRAWSLIVIFALWGISSLLAALEYILDAPRWLWLYGLVFLPGILSTYLLLRLWKPSPYQLFRNRLYSQAKEVLNDMAQQNKRPPINYALEGESKKDDLFIDKSPSYIDLLYEPSLQKLTIPLLALWIFREYVYYGSFTLIPALSHEYSKNYILISISETVAVLMSYPIRLKIRRVNTFFTLSLIIAAAALLASLTTPPPECLPLGERCTAKFVQRVAIMLIRFAIALTGNVLISYTLEVYPANLRNLAYSFCLTLSAAGSILLPWINSLAHYLGLSGFIGIAVVSLAPLYLTPKLPETQGRMNGQNFVDWQNRAPLISLQSWKRPKF